MLTDCHIGETPTIRRRIGGGLHHVDGLHITPSGVVTSVTADTDDGEVFEFELDCLEEAGTHTIRWNGYRDENDDDPQEAREAEFRVHPTAFDEPFAKPYGIVQVTKPYRKHTGYNVNEFIQSLAFAPETGDVILVFLWNTSSNPTTMPSGQGWVQHIKQAGPPNPNIRCEVWGKRWGDIGQTDSLEWEVFNSSGIIIGWSVVVRGCAQSGTWIDAVDTVASGSAAGAITYPSVVCSGANRLVLRMASSRGEIQRTYRHGTTSEGKLREQANVYLDGEPGYANPVVFSAAESVRGAGSTGTATLTTVSLPTPYLWHTATVALLPAS